jgi:aspartyl-tRNA(Asn)/glutamyl-tRNA(Gln) amidotransferase subunit A
MDGAFPLSTTLDSAGPLAPGVACCAVIDAVLAGEPPVAPTQMPFTGLRLAVPQTLVLDRLDETVARDFDRALTTLSRAGARITEIPFEDLAEVPKLNANGGIFAEAYAVHRNRLRTDADQYDPRVASRILRVKDMDVADYYDVLQARAALIKDADATTAPFDAVITPTTAIVAPPIAAFDDDDKYYGATNLLMLRNTFCFNFLDRCALSIPMHRPGDAPTGLMVVGETMGDRRLLSIGLAIEETLR